MSNRGERKFNRLSSRVSKMMGGGGYCHWRSNNKLTYTENPQESINSHKHLYVDDVGVGYILRCPAIGFNWEGKKLHEGIKQFKITKLIAG